MLQEHETDRERARASDFPRSGTSREQLTFLVHCAILAPSSHNTQPWKFSIRENEIRLYADKSRWLKVADADQRELHLSIGCALENLLIAAQEFGYAPILTYFPDDMHSDCVASIFLPWLHESVGRRPELFGAIPRRHTSRNVYDGRAITEDIQQRLRETCVEDGIALFLTGDAEVKRKVDELVRRADALQFADEDFRHELGAWIGEGAFGTPWLVSKLGQALTHFNTGESAARKDSELVMSAPLFGLICSTHNDRVSQVKTGQVFERIGLRASVEGLTLQPMSQLCQVREIKAELGGLFSQRGLYPQQPFRMGYAPCEKAHTPRRNVADVLL